MTTPTLDGPLVDAPAPTHGAPERSFVRRVWRGRPEDPRWARPAFFGALLVIGALYAWNLTASGYANSFYSAAVQAGSQSWKAFFFGSLDAGNAITVDKPPAALWPMALSVRLLGLSSFAILFPQVLMAVATAGVLYASVRRHFAAPAGLLTVAVFALTPVAALMFRFNNPDAALALLMATAVYCTQRALEKAGTKWLLLAGTAVGLAFLVKTLQAFLILPVLALVHVVLAPAPLRKRIGQVLLAGLAMIVAGGWWVAVVELWPASARPYIGGSQNNSFLELTFGYNGLGRINGEETGSVGGGQGGGWGETGWDRMFGSNIGGQISWLIPAALILLAAALLATRKAPRTDGTRAAFVLWGGSLLITMVIFSFMQGIFHEYYTVALAPYVAPLVGMGAALLWRERGRAWAPPALAAAMTATAAWGYVLLDRASGYHPWLKWAVLGGGLAAALGLLFANRLGRRLALGVVALSCATGLAGPAAYSLTTLGEGHTGSIVTAGPAVAGGGMGGGRPGGGGGPGGGGFPDGGPIRQGQQGQQGQQPGGQDGGTGRPPTGGFPGQNGQPGQQGQQGQNGLPGGQDQTPGGRPGEGGGMGGGVGGLLNGAAVSDEARELLEADAGEYTWAAAAIGAQNAASHQLATGEPVMAIGGFNGTDPSPILARFQQYVADGRVHYFVASGDGGTGGGMGGDGGTSARISAWVEANFTKVTAGSATFYDLTRPKG
ncbi:glycosyltransferase family 39 protein [Streptomyces pharetrae]|uniref:ArnT family glycosyltransferase n=1 Tax=Streptomyces pharetrae TaxID=291370 RepID=UPI00335CD106